MLWRHHYHHHHRCCGDQCGTKALSIWKKVHAEEHGNVVESCFSLANDCSNIGENDQTIECGRKALNIRRKDVRGGTR